MPARKNVSVESSSIPDSSQVPNGNSSARPFNSSTTTSSRNSSSKTSKSPSNPKIDLVFSKKFTYQMTRSSVNYKKLPKFIEEALRYINTFNYPYEMFYYLNEKEHVFSSRTDDTMKVLKDICESDEGRSVESVYIMAENKVGVKTFIAYNLDLVAFIIFLVNLIWFIFVGSPESKFSASAIGVGLGVAIYWKYLR